ncbi:MAG: hypothetical protein Kow0029_24960 [Candidatus Rifleibacteriota bacterium]
MIFFRATGFNHDVNNRRGMVFYLVLSVVVIMGIFIGFYHSFSRQLAFSSFHHANRERLRNLTDILLDSAFSNIQICTRDANHEITKKLIAQMRSPSLDKTFFPVEAPLFEECKSELLLGANFDYKIGARVFDKRIENPRGHKYHDGEGLGTLELKLEAALKTSSGKVLVSCVRYRQFDMKSACLVSSYKERENSYAMTFPLDFALLVRDGLREFSEGYRGQAYNSGKKLVIKDQSAIPADKRGLLYFGNADTNNESKRIYLNTTDAESALLPTLETNKFEIDQAECIRLIPEAGPGSDYKGLKGVFTITVKPAVISGTAADETEDLTRYHLEILPGNKRLISAPAGLVIEGDGSKSYLESFVRGAVTQRFFYYSKFTFDTSNLETITGDPIPAEGKKKIEDSVKGFLSLDPNCPYLSDSSIPNTDARQKRKILAGKIKMIMDKFNPPMSLHSGFSEDYLYESGQKITKTLTPQEFPQPPKFFSRNGSPLSSINLTGGEGFRPFRHCTLYATRFLYASELEKSGVYDRKNGVLNLRGIVSVEFEPVILSSSGGSITVRGQGAILAPNGFTIQAGLKREDPTRDLCILFSRKGNINIATSEPIEASLLAFNDSNNASIVPNKNFKVIGSVGVDRLYLNRFPSTPSEIEYDPRLKVVSKSDEIFAITISPWIRFENITFSKD